MIARVLEINIGIKTQLFQVINRNNRTSCEMCSKLVIKTPERRDSHR